MNLKQFQRQITEDLQQKKRWISFCCDDWNLVLDFIYLYKRNKYKQFNFCIFFSADNILKHFSYFSQKTGFDISQKLSLMETICMKCQVLFPAKNKKNITDLLSAELAQRVVEVK